MKRDVIATLLRAGRHDLANAIAHMAVAKAIVVHEGVFEIRTTDKWAERLEKIKEELADVEQRCARLGLKLKGPIRIDVKAEGFRSNSYYSRDGWIKLIPTFHSGSMLGVMVHEMAHYIHAQMLPQGFQNKIVLDKWQEIVMAESQRRREKSDKSSKSSNFVPPPKERDERKLAEWIDAQGYDQLQETIKILQYTGSKLAVSLKRGQVVEWEDWDDTTRKHVMRKGKIVSNSTKGIVIEILTPTASELKVGNKLMETMSRHGAIERITSVQEKGRMLIRLLSRAYTRHNDFATRKIDAPESRYTGDWIDEWFPTAYAQTNSREWFAELFTAYVLAPSKFSDRVKDFLVDVLRHTQAH